MILRIINALPIGVRRGGAALAFGLGCSLALCAAAGSAHAQTPPSGGPDAGAQAPAASRISDAQGSGAGVGPSGPVRESAQGQSAPEQTVASRSAPQDERTSASVRTRQGSQPEPEEQGVTVLGSSSRSIERVPGSASVLSERELQRTQPLTVNEALRRVPGIYVRDEEGMGLRPNISVRGLDPTRSRRVLMLEDGIPVSLAPYSEPEMYYNPPIDRMLRVEVVRGSGNILYGPNTIGGVINYVTPMPPRREAWSLRTSVGDRAFWSAMATYGNTVGNAGFVVNVLRRQGNGFRNMGFEVTDLVGTFVLRMGPRSEIRLRLGVYDEGSASTYLGLTQPMFERDPTQNPAIYDWFRLRRYSTSVIHTWTIAPQIQLRTLIYGYTTDRNWDRQRYDRTPTPNLAYERIVGDQQIPGGAIYLRDASLSNDRHYEVVGIEPRLQARFGIGRFRNELDAGARFLYERSMLRVLLGSRALARSGDLSTEEQRDGIAVAGYIQDRFFVTERLQVTPGVRVESYFYSRLMRRDAGVDVHRRGHGNAITVIPGLSVSYGSPALTVFAGAHVGYAPPRIAAAINTAGTSIDLGAEQSVNYELGTRIHHSTWLRAEATAFLIDFRNEIITVSGHESEFRNGGATRHMGLEAQGSIDFGRLLRAPTSVYLSARYTLVDARIVPGANDPPERAALYGNMVPYAVPHTLTLSAGFEHPSGISGQATWLFVSHHFSDEANTPEGSTDGRFGPIPAYQTLDLSMRYTHRRTGLGFSVAVKNIQGYFTDANGRPNVYIASRAPEGIFPGGFGQVLVGVRWDHQ